MPWFDATESGFKDKDAVKINWDNIRKNDNVATNHSQSK